MNLDTTETPTEHFCAAELLNRCMGNAPMAQKMAGLFLASVDKDVEQIQNKVDSGDWVQAASLTHRLKGTAATVGANYLSKVASALEQCLKANATTEIPVHWSRLREEKAATAAAIQTFISSPS